MNEKKSTRFIEKITKLGPFKILLILFFLFIAYFIIFVAILKYPILAVSLSDKYARDLFFIYEKENNCSFLGCSPEYQIVKAADPFSFRVVYGDVAVDNKFTYCGQRSNLGNPLSIVYLGDNFLKSDIGVMEGCNAVFHNGDTPNGPLSNFEPNSSESLGCGLLKDKSGIYYRGSNQIFSRTIMEPQNFRVTNSFNNTNGQICSAQDSSYEYKIDKYGIKIVKSIAPNKSVKNGNCSYQEVDQGIVKNAIKITGNIECN